MSDYPVQLTVQHPERSSRILALLSIPFFLARAVLVIPAYVVLQFILVAAWVVAWIAQWAVLFTGSYPEGMHRFVAGAMRWQARVHAYVIGLTDRYPPFSLD